MTNVIKFNGKPPTDLPPERILNEAVNADLWEAVVIGWRKDGSFYFASSIADGADVNWLLDRAKKELQEAFE
jgi:hypothetical protein